LSHKLYIVLVNIYELQYSQSFVCYIKKKDYYSIDHQQTNLKLCY